MSTKTASFVFRLLSVLMLLNLLIVAVGVSPAYAAGLVVNSLLDTTALDGYCTLREAIINANNDTATYPDCAAGAGADTITFIETYTVTLGNQLPAVTSTLRIIGNGAANTIIQADVTPNTATYRIFEVSHTGNLSLDNLTVQNGSCHDSCATVTNSGGGILNEGILAVTNSTLSDNSVDGIGGGIYSDGNLSVTNSTLSNNSAYSGGGIFNFNGTLTVTDSTLSGNSTNSNGGGISNYHGTLNVTNSTLSGNSTNGAYSGGGGISNYDGTLNVTNSTLSGNSAYGGGGIDNTGTLNVTNSTLSGNSAIQSGGAISNYDGSLSVMNSTLSDNSAGEAGGGIFNYQGSLSVMNSMLSDNSAIQSGGGIHGSGTLRVTNSTLLGNSTTGGGGGIYSQDNLSVINSTLSDNFASSGGGGIGNNGSLSVINSTFLGNSSANSGGGIENSGSLNMINSTLSGNSARYGGGIENSGSLSMINSTLSGNSAHSGNSAYYGGGIDNSGTTALQNSIVVNSPSGGDCNGAITADSYNLDSDGSCGGATQNTTAEINLGLLADNGGPTQTLALLAGSSAIDAGNDAVCAAAPVSNASQNGVTRPHGAHCDIGSYEKTPIFADVPLGHWAIRYIERLYDAGVTGGCGGNPLIYCPDMTVTRAQMAIFLLRGIHGPDYNPPSVGTSTGFTDVAPTYWASAWIKQLAFEGITSGCGPGLYCPEATVTRAQMAIFLLRGEHGSAYIPPDASGAVFSDVAAGSFAAAWIEQLALEGITGGCDTDIYCPAGNVTRAEMAVFLVRTFNLNWLRSNALP